MKRVHPLSVVLRLRRLAEEQEERLLDKILVEKIRTEELVRQERQAVTEAYSARQRGGNSVPASELQAHYAEVSAHTERIDKFEEQKQKLKDLANHQRVALQKTRQQRETVESLLDKQRETAELAERRLEQRMLDDIHGSQRVRRQLAAALARHAK